MDEVPEDATHKWIPAIEEPFYGGGFFRRAYYKQVNGIWYSYSFSKEWQETQNSPEWFTTGIELNEFVEI